MLDVQLVESRRHSRASSPQNPHLPKQERWADNKAPDWLELSRTGCFRSIRALRVLSGKFGVLSLPRRVDLETLISSKHSNPMLKVAFIPY